jgi:hypothetical protein
MRPPRVPPQPAARSAAWPIGLLVALCFTTLPLFLALSPGRPSLLDLWQQMGIRVTVHYGSRSCLLRVPKRSQMRTAIRARSLTRTLPDPRR